jgi:hypothetical protein
MADVIKKIIFETEFVTEAKRIGIWKAATHSEPPGILDNLVLGGMTSARE